MPSLLSKSGGKSRFELPALNLNFGSITDGTNIPPPPDSPVHQKVPTPPQTPPGDDVSKERQDSFKSTDPGNGNKLSTINEGQQSTNGNITPGNISRPESRSGLSFMDERKSKRNSGWFRRLRSSDSVKRSSMIFEEPPASPASPAVPAATVTPKKPSGPPPPMIPELTDIEKDDGSLGADLFKNIK